LNRLRLLAVGLLLIAAGAADVSAEARFPLPPALKDLAKPGIRLDAPVRMTADTLSYDEETGVALAEGNVEMGFGTRTMRADRIRYDSTTGEADLTGKVRYKDADEEFAFDRITINLDSEKGVLYNGTIRISSNNYQITSKKIEKTGKSSFLIEKGSLTTCPCDPEPDWKFEVRRAQVTIDQYAVGKDITFRIRGVPVLWLPWGAFPVKMTRQSGFLLPNFSTNKSRGFTLHVPYYQVINRWSDATVTLDAMSHRGYRPEIEYRFVLNPESIGAVRATYFRDREYEGNRGRFYGENVFRSGPFTANAVLEVPTDPNYYLDLVDNNALLWARYARSEGFVSVTGTNSEHALSVVWNKDLQETPGPDNTAQRVPEYTMSLLPVGIPVAGIDLAGEVSATRFQRGNGNDEFRARGYGEVVRAIPLYRSITLVPYLFADVLGSGLQGLFHQRLLVHGLAVQRDVAPFLEHPGDTAAGAQTAAVLGEDVPDLRHGAVFVVGEGLDEDRRTPGPVALVDDLLVVHALQFAGALLDAALDVVLGHVFGPGRQDRRPEPGVAQLVAAAHAGGHRDLLDQLGENLAALGIVGALLVLDARPLIVT